MEMPQRTAALVVNRDSRLGESDLAAVEQAIREGGWDLAWSESLDSEALQGLLPRLRGIDAVFVGGGDGTQRMAAEVLQGTQAALAPIPLGTGNALARDLGIPLHPVRAAEALAQGQVQAIDLGEANGKIFLNLASMGFTADVARGLDSDWKRMVGRFAYLAPLADALENSKPFQVLIRIGGEAVAFRTILLAAGPGGSQGGVLPLPGPAGHQTGRLVLYGVRSEDPISLAALALDLRSGREPAPESVFVAEVSEAVIQCDPPQRVVLDGEDLVETPITLRCLPGALRVLAPA